MDQLTSHRTRPDPASLLEVYIDETSQTKHQFLLLGAIVVPKLASDAAEEALQLARMPELPHGEMKWGKVSNSKIAAYFRVVDAFFEHDAFKGVHFHSLVIDTHKIDDKKYNDGDREIGFNKEIYQLASKCARLYSGLFHLYPDERQTSQTPENLRQILNAGRRKSGDKRDWPFRRCQFRDSKKSRLLQLSDLLIGAIAYEINGHSAALEASAAKIKLSSHILDKAGVKNPMRDTATSGKFTIWHRQLRR